MSSGLQVRETPDPSSPEYYQHPSNVDKEPYTHQAQPYFRNSNPTEEAKYAQYKPDENNTGNKDFAFSRVGPVWLIIITAVVTAIIVGAAIGGGLGSSLQQAQKKGCVHPVRMTGVSLFEGMMLKP